MDQDHIAAPGRRGDGRYELLLQNSDREASREMTLTSALWLGGATVTEQDLLGRSLRIIPVQQNAITLCLPANGCDRVRHREAEMSSWL